MDLKIKTKKTKNGNYIISLIGSLDSETYYLLEKEITSVLKHSPKGIILNMQRLDYISSIGLGLVFKTKKAMDEKEGTLLIANLKPDIKRIFEAVKAIPEEFFATIEGPDEYLDNYISRIYGEDRKADDK
jgi:anti-sigma B factor antagonist